MKTVSFINLKGGVGKTISAINFAYDLAALHGMRVLLIDNDKQANTTHFFDLHSYDAPGIAEIMTLDTLDAAQAIKQTRYSGLDLLPSNMNLAAANMAVYEDSQRPQLSRLRNALEGVQSNYDYCVIDNAPDVNMSIWNALAASDAFLIPVKIDNSAFCGIRDLLEQVDEMQETDPGLKRLHFRGCFVTMARRSIVNRQGREYLRDTCGYPLFETEIRDTVKVAETTYFKTPLQAYDKNSTAAQDYAALVAEYLAGDCDRN